MPWFLKSSIVMAAIGLLCYERIIACRPPEVKDCFTKNAPFQLDGAMGGGTGNAKH